MAGLFLRLPAELVSALHIPPKIAAKTATGFALVAVCASGVKRRSIVSAMRSPTGLLQDQPPALSIVSAARPITDIEGVNSQADWVGGLNLWWDEGTAKRWRHQSLLDGSDDDISTIADPSVWPAAVDSQEAGQTVVAFPYGLKDKAADPVTTAFRSFTVYAPSAHLDLAQNVGSANRRATNNLTAHIAAQIAAEFTDSLYTKNPGLQRTGSDQSPVSGDPVDPAVAMSTLYEAHGSDGAGDAALTLPYHAIPFFMSRRLVEWRGDQLLDVYGNPVLTAPGLIPGSPISDPDDLETSGAPGAGEGYSYISHVPYVGVGDFREVTQELTAGQRGIYAKGNEQVGLAEAPAIVVFRPIRVHAVLTSLNEIVGT